MHWTTTLPRHAGHYWVQYRGVLSGRISQTVVSCYARSVSPGAVVDTVHWGGENVSIQRENFLAWSNEPIMPPDESPQ